MSTSTSYINYSESFSNFLRDNRDNKVARVLLSCHYHTMSGRNAPKLMVTNQAINHITLRTDGTISYLPKGKEHKLNDDGDWAREGRQSGKPSRVIRKLFTPKGLKTIKDADFESFAVQYQSTCDRERKTFSILPASDIPKVYCHNRESGYGSLNKSCMNDDGSYLTFYTHVPKLQIIVLHNAENELAGRALLWELEDGTKFMDRVYTTQDMYYPMFIDFAQENGFIRKVHYKSYDDKTEITLDNGKTSINKTMYIRFDVPSGISYPYIDTFTYGSDRGLTNDSSGEEYSYNNTNGIRNGDNNVYCEVTNEYIHEDDSVYIDRGDYADQTVHSDYAVRIGHYWYCNEGSDVVEVGNTWYKTDSDEIVNIDGEWYPSEDCVYCDIDSCDYLLEDCVQLHDGEWCLSSDAYKVCDEYYHENDVSRA